MDSVIAMGHPYGPEVERFYGPFPTSPKLTLQELYEKAHELKVGPSPRPFNQNPKVEAVDHPKHYTTHPSGIEAIQVTEHMGFNLGNAVKYIWRCDLKKDAIEDLKKALWYINREIQKREKK